jgi:deazaflavin-dependent oxidoreductase (nitroreductase family)
MTAATAKSSIGPATSEPRFGGVLWRSARLTSPLMIGLAGRRWNPIFSIVEHVGRRSGRTYTAPIAARRMREGFVISLAFGAQVDWYRNLQAAGGGVIRWRDRRYQVDSPVRIGRDVALAAFHPIQRLLIRIAGVDGFVEVHDAKGPA